MDGLGTFQKCVLGLHQCSGEQPRPLHAQVKPYRDVLFQSLAEQKIGNLEEELALVKVFVRN